MGARQDARCEQGGGCPVECTIGPASDLMEGSQCEPTAGKAVVGLSHPERQMAVGNMVCGLYSANFLPQGSEGGVGHHCLDTSVKWRMFLICSSPPGGVNGDGAVQASQFCEAQAFPKEFPTETFASGLP
jgi:hypothetical protein